MATLTSFAPCSRRMLSGTSRTWDRSTPDLLGPEAVLAMMREAQEFTGGTFSLSPREVVANGEHAVAMIDWSAERGGERMEGKEVAVYRIRGGKVVEASFHQDDADLDRRFWEYLRVDRGGARRHLVPWLSSLFALFR